MYGYQIFHILCSGTQETKAIPGMGSWQDFHAALPVLATIFLHSLPQFSVDSLWHLMEVCGQGKVVKPTDKLTIRFAQESWPNWLELSGCKTSFPGLDPERKEGIVTIHYPDRWEVRSSSRPHHISNEHLYTCTCIAMKCKYARKKCKRIVTLFNPSVFWSAKKVSISGKPVATRGRPGNTVWSICPQVHTKLWQHDSSFWWTRKHTLPIRNYPRVDKNSYMLWSWTSITDLTGHD